MGDLSVFVSIELVFGASSTQCDSFTTRRWQRDSLPGYPDSLPKFHRNSCCPFHCIHLGLPTVASRLTSLFSTSSSYTRSAFARASRPSHNPYACTTLSFYHFITTFELTPHMFVVSLSSLHSLRPSPAAARQTILVIKGTRNIGKG